MLASPAIEPILATYTARTFVATFSVLKALVLYTEEIGCASYTQIHGKFPWHPYRQSATPGDR